MFGCVYAKVFNTFVKLEEPNGLKVYGLITKRFKSKALIEIIIRIGSSRSFKLVI